MAADLASLRTALGRMGFDNSTRNNITSAEDSTPPGQGYTTLEMFAKFDDKRCISLCNALRKPGGTIANPTEGQPPIRNPGFHVGDNAENNLKLMCYFLKHQIRTSRSLNFADVTVDNVTSLIELKQAEDNHEDPTPIEFDTKDPMRSLEAVFEYLSQCRGITFIPLAYVVRPDTAVATDPNNDRKQWPTEIDEMIYRAPILDAQGNYTATFKKDRATVYLKLSNICKDPDIHAVIRQCARAKDGRQAYTLLRNRYLSASEVQTYMNKAHKLIHGSTYYGERRNFTFETYQQRHRDGHLILENLKRDGKIQEGIDDASKVMYLTQGIKTTELDAVKNIINVTAALRTDFDGCVNLFRQSILSRANNTSQDRNGVKIAGVGIGTDSEKDSADMSIELRYYSQAEYRKLTPEQKMGLKIKRQEAKANGEKLPKKPKNKQTKKGPKNGPPTAWKPNKRTIKAIAAAVAKAKATESDTESTSSQDSTPPALKRKKAKKSRSD